MRFISWLMINSGNAIHENILLLVQGNQRSIYIESLVIEFRKAGYNSVIGSIGTRGALQEYLEQQGFTCYCFYRNRHPLLLFYIANYFFWRRIKNKHKISFVFSHLQWANFIALLIGFFSFRKVIVIPTRHHIDASYLHHSRNARIEDMVINLFASKQVVVSEHAKKFMLENERFAKSEKIHVVPLGYDFNAYAHLQNGKAEELREENSCRLLLCTISRLVKTKKHLLVIEALAELKKRNLDIKLMILDDGPEKDVIIERITELNVSDYVKMYGNRSYIIDYIRASDLLVQPSIEESSNQVVKEAAISGKTAIVTKHIGDFDEYIIDKKNAFFIDSNTDALELADLIESIYRNKYDLHQMAAVLEKEVRIRFGIDTTVEKYNKIAGLK